MNENNEDVTLTGLEKARYNSIQTRKLKKLNTYIKNKSILQIKYHNELIFNLIQTGIYTDIHNKLIDNRESELNHEDFEILKEFKFIEPHKLKELYI